jgi:methionyl-tRNA formyltransferase
VDYISSFKPDLIITTYFDHVIKKDLINLPKFGIINVHTALLPDYKGPFPALWPLINKEKKIGVTVHYINNEDLDVGPIISQKECPVIDGESVLGADCRLVREGVELAIKSVYDIEEGVVKSIDQEILGRGRYYGYPSKLELSRSTVKLSRLRDFLVQFF